MKRNDEQNVISWCCRCSSCSVCQ